MARVAPWTLLFLVGVVSLLTASCSSTKMVGFSDSESLSLAPVQSVVVVMVDERRFLREAMENQVMGQLQNRKVQAFASYTKVPIKGLGDDKEEARRKLSVWDADAVLVMRLTDRTDLSKPPEFVSDTSDWELVWADPTAKTTFDPSPWGGQVQVTVRLESKLYHLSDASLMWVGYTDTTMKEFTNDLNRIRSVAKLIVQRLAKDKMIE